MELSGATTGVSNLIYILLSHNDAGSIAYELWQWAILYHLF